MNRTLFQILSQTMFIRQQPNVLNIVIPKLYCFIGQFSHFQGCYLNIPISKFHQNSFKNF